MSNPLIQRYYPGFTERFVPTRGAVIHTLVGGEGPPLLLLHGFPQNLLIWREIAPALAKKYTVVLTDLRGYGDSSKPDGDERHENYSKRAMARDQAEVMASLGFSQFPVVGHDRGARVAQQLALDFPEQVSRAMLLDIVPSDHVYRTADWQVASIYFHWFLLIQPAPLPEAMLQGGVAVMMARALGNLVPGVVPQDVYDHYLQCAADPLTQKAFCEDYRAGATIDQQYSGAGQRKIACPVRLLWGARGLVGMRYDPLAVWRDYALDVTGLGMDCGHWMPEEVPGQIVTEIQTFVG